MIRVSESGRYIGTPNGIVLCVNSRERGGIEGKLYHGYSKEGILFKGYEEIIKIAEKFFDALGFPHSFAVTYVRLSPEILLFPGFQAFFISIFSHILLDIYGCICYNSHSGGAYYAFKENKNQYRTYLSCDC